MKVSAQLPPEPPLVCYAMTFSPGPPSPFYKGNPDYTYIITNIHVMRKLQVY